MKHCHFSIIYNELALLKQKLPFLYEHFDQLIFYDLNVMGIPYSFSDDGTHEYIYDFPDPENKIRLIEETNLDRLPITPGGSHMGKRKMFIYGSQFVDNDIDVFWCTDTDEFFNATLIKRVEQVLTEHKDVDSIELNQYYFWKNRKFIICWNGKDTRNGPIRITRHKKGNVYGHCSLRLQYPSAYEIEDELLYHFSCVGDKRMRFKSPRYPFRDDYWKTWDSFDESKVGEEEYGYPDMHPNPTIPAGVKRYHGRYPDYLDLKAIEDGS
jgi:hypothetical protein